MSERLAIVVLLAMEALYSEVSLVQTMFKYTLRFRQELWLFVRWQTQVVF